MGGAGCFGIVAASVLVSGLASLVTKLVRLAIHGLFIAAKENALMAQGLQCCRMNFSRFL